MLVSCVPLRDLWQGSVCATTIFLSISTIAPAGMVKLSTGASNKNCPEGDFFASRSDTDVLRRRENLSFVAFDSRNHNHAKSCQIE